MEVEIMVDVSDGHLGQVVGVGRGPGVSSAADVQIASGMITRIEDLEAKRRGATVEEVRPRVARHIGIGTGTSANIRKQRRQSVPAWMLGRIRAVLIDVLQTEIRALEHELAIHRLAAVDHRDDALGTAAARLAEAKAILTEAVR